MSRWMRALPALLAVLAVACSDDGGSRGPTLFPLAPSTIAQATSCADVRSVPPPARVAGVIEAGTMTTITQAGTYGLGPAGVPLKLGLTGTGEYRVIQSEQNAFGTGSSFTIAAGIGDGSAVRQWTLQAPASVTLTPTPGGSFTIVVCAA